MISLNSAVQYTDADAANNVLILDIRTTGNHHEIHKQFLF